MKKTINTLEDALIIDLETLYCAEQRLKSKLDKITRIIQSDRLRNVLEQYLDDCESKRLQMDRVFSYLNHEPKSCTTSVMDEMIEEIFKHITFANEGFVQDLLIINCLQRINNYKLSLYNASLRYAEELELDTPSDLLSAIISSERDTMRDLEELCIAQLNICSIKVC